MHSVGRSRWRLHHRIRSIYVSLFEIFRLGPSIPDTFIAECFARHRRGSLTERLQRALNEIETKFRLHHRYEIIPEDRGSLTPDGLEFAPRACALSVHGSRSSISRR